MKSVPAIEIKIQDRVRKSGQWARITFTVTNLISLLGGPVDADAIRRLPQASTEIAIWVPAWYLPSDIKPFKNEAKKKASTSHSTCVRHLGIGFATRGTYYKLPDEDRHS